MIHVKKAEIDIDEQTLRDILKVIEKAKEELAPFCDDPMPEGDMSKKAFNRELAKRGKILISSPYGVASYRVDLSDPRMHECEGYRVEL